MRTGGGEKEGHTMGNPPETFCPQTSKGQKFPWGRRGSVPPRADFCFKATTRPSAVTGASAAAHKEEKTPQALKPMVSDASTRLQLSAFHSGWAENLVENQILSPTLHPQLLNKYPSYKKLSIFQFLQRTKPWSGRATPHSGMEGTGAYRPPRLSQA